MKTIRGIQMGVWIMLILFGYNQYSDAQVPMWEWAKSIGPYTEDDGFSMAVDPGTGDVYSTGFFHGTVDFDPGPGEFHLTSQGLADIFICKLDNAGDFVWARSMGGPDGSGGISIAVDPSGTGDVYTTGWFYETVDFDPGQASYILTAEGRSDIFISKLDRDGNFVWARAIGGPDYDLGNSIVIDPSRGDVYATGTFEETVDFDPSDGAFPLTSAGFDDIFVLKLNTSGDFLWGRSIGGPNYENSLSIAVDPEGGIYATGNFEGIVDFNPGPDALFLNAAGDYDIFVLQLDGAGDFVWAKDLGGPEFDYSVAIALDPKTDAVYITGYFHGIADFDPGEGINNLTSNGAQDAFITKLDASGDFLWAKSFGGSAGDGSLSIAVNKSGDGDIFITGGFRGTVDFDPGAETFALTSAGTADIFVSKFDSTGDFLWVKSAGGSDGESGSSIATDNAGNLYVKGDFYSAEISFDTLTLANEDPSGEYSNIFIARLSSTVTAIPSFTSSATPVIYPNPTQNTIHIEMPEESGDAHLSIFNTPGQKVLDQPITDLQNTVDISRLPAGIYFMRITKDGLVLTQKLLKE